MTPDKIYDLKKAVQKGVVLVEFKKADGSIRRMRCTVNSAFFSEDFKVREQKKNEIVLSDVNNPILQECKPIRKSNPAVYNVYDLDKDDWRSFRYDSVIRWEVENNE